MLATGWMMSAENARRPGDWLDLSGQVAVVTGAASGIGRACASMFYRAGATLAVADLDDRALLATLEVDGVPPSSVLAEGLDVTDPSACDDFAKRVAGRFGAIHAIVPSAGIYRSKPFADLTFADWQETMSVNLDGVFNTLHPLLPVLADNGSITLLSSRAGHGGGSAGHVHYGATKGAMLSLARGLARELGPRIRVNAVSPGVIETPMIGTALAVYGEDVLAQTPLKRFGRADDVAAAILFLSSGLASFITGETLQVNGGLYMS